MKTDLNKATWARIRFRLFGHPIGWITHLYAAHHGESVISATPEPSPLWSAPDGGNQGKVTRQARKPISWNWHGARVFLIDRSDEDMDRSLEAAFGTGRKWREANQ